MSSGFGCHGALHPMDDYSRMSLDSMDDHQGRAILSLSHQLPLCPCVVRPKNAIYPSSSSIFFIFFDTWSNLACFNHGFSSFKTDATWLILIGHVASDVEPCCL